MLDAPPPPWKPAPVVHRSPATAQAGPLDLASVTLGQDGIRLQLVVKTRGAYDAAALSVRGRRALCLDLVYGPARQRVALCVGSAGERPVLRRVQAGRATRIAATVSLRAKTLTARFTPADAGLPFGALRWSVRSRWNGGADRVPRRGTIAGHARLLGGPRCFGASALDTQAPCTNPALRRVVSPTPEDALLIPGAPCTVVDAAPLLSPCHFGVAPDVAREWVALIGDSHAEHWRAALDVAAQAERWRVVALTRGGCPLTDTPVRHYDPPQAAECQGFNAAARQWLADHPDVRTVFVSAHDLSLFAGDAVAGYRSAWQSLPRSVERIYVIRDTPSRVRLDTSECVERRLRRHQPIGDRCAEPRAIALPPDPQVEAAQAPGDDRVRLLDLSDAICAPTTCAPVVGGVLVLRDTDHLTRAFSTTLGPYLLRALSA